MPPVQTLRENKLLAEQLSRVSALRERRVITALREQAGKGVAHAAFDLGVRFRSGRGVPQHAGEAHRLFCIAADAGHQPAALEVAYELHLGGSASGAERDTAKAVRMYELALYDLDVENCDSEYGEGAHNLACLVVESGTTAAVLRAASLFRAAGEMGFAAGYASLAQMHESGSLGLCGHADLGAAAHYATLANEESGCCLPAKLCLARLHLKGWAGTPRNPRASFQQLLEVHESGISPWAAQALLPLGRLYDAGMGCPTNPALAASLYQTAMECDDGESPAAAEAAYKLSSLYRDGRGVNADEAEADRLLFFSASLRYQPAADSVDARCFTAAEAAIEGIILAVGGAPKATQGDEGDMQQQQQQQQQQQLSGVKRPREREESPSHPDSTASSPSVILDALVQTI